MNLEREASFQNNENHEPSAHPAEIFLLQILHIDEAGQVKYCNVQVEPVVVFVISLQYYL